MKVFLKHKKTHAWGLPANQLLALVNLFTDTEWSKKLIVKNKYDTCLIYIQFC